MSEIQLVVFRLGREEYGVNIMQVREIVPYKEPVKVPNTPSFIEGVINLRGSIIPIVNLKTRFNLSGDGISDQTRIIVMNISNKQVGFIVDDASEVLTIAQDNVEPAPEIIIGIDRKYITGIGKVENRILIILDLNELFSEHEHSQLVSM